MLSSYIIDKIEQISEFTACWFYCKFAQREKNTFLAVVRAVIAQLVKKNDSLRPHIIHARSNSGSTELASQNAAKHLAEDCIRTSKQVCLVIDGLDECGLDERKSIISFFTGLAKTMDGTEPGCFRALFVSTDEADIRKCLTTAKIIHMRATDNRSEMMEYSRKWSTKIQELHQLSDAKTETIALSVLERSAGRYIPKL